MVKSKRWPRQYGKSQLSCIALVLGLICQGAVWAEDWAISGTIVGPDKTLDIGVVSMAGERISAVGEAAAPGVKVIKLDGIVMPGMIDLHNHLTWNMLPRWVPNRAFANRYAWQVQAEYDRSLVAPHNAVMDAAACEAEIYGEIKALIGGATTVAGSLLPNASNPGYQACAKGLTRNLDVASELGFPGAASADSCQKDPAKPQPLLDYISYEVFPLEMKPERMEFMRCTLKSGALRALVVHLSEGAPGDGSARREFRMLNATWLIQEGLVVVHGTALRAEDFQVLGKANAGLVWSPRSNEELYGDTTNVAAAAASQVAIAIAPDWSPTGSAGMLQELGYASRRTSLFANDKLVQMATSIPAKLARLDDRIGTLAPGKFADLVVVRGDRKRPFDAITRATPADIQLVVIGGRPIYGDAAVMKQLLPNATLESLTVCGAGKAINLANSAAGERHQSFADIQKLLSSALSKAGSSLAPIECN